MTNMAQAADSTLVGQSKSIFERVSESVFNPESIIVFILSFACALLAGRVVAAVLRGITKVISNRADKIEDLGTVNRLRRLETIIVLSIATIRMLFILLAVYYWWVFTHQGQQSTAILGAGAVLTLILSGALSPLLRDFASGSVMMAEQWYGVGDHIHIEPFPDAQGIVERVTLRATKLRKFNGEIYWINNKDIAGVSIAPRGVRSVVFELFAKDPDKAAELIEETNLRLPRGPLTVIVPLSIMESTQVGKDLWHLTAVSEVAPGREWFLDQYAISVMQELDEQDKVLAHEPIARYADSEAERRFARAIKNSRKSPVRRESMVTKVAQKRKQRPPRSKNEAMPPTKQPGRSKHTKTTTYTT